MVNYMHMMLLLCVSMVQAINGMQQFSHAVVRQCRPLVKSICHKRILDKEVIHHIVQKCPDDTVQYLTAINAGYALMQQNENLRPPIAMSDQLQREFFNSVIQYRVMSSVRGCVASAVTPSIVILATMSGITGAMLIPASFILSIDKEVFEVDTLIFNLACMAVGAPTLLGTSYGLFSVSKKLCDTIQNDLLKNKESVRSNIIKNNAILSEFLGQYQYKKSLNCDLFTFSQQTSAL